MCPACDGWAVDTGPAATGRMRVFVGLTVAGSVLLMVGVITVLVGEAMRVKSPHGWQGIVRLGETVAACGLGCGLALLAAAAAGRPGARRPAVRSRTAAQPPSESTSRAASGPASAAGPVARLSPGTGTRPGPAVRSGRSVRAQDRYAQDQALPGYTWDGGTQDAWRRDSADDWLSPLRNSAAGHAPEPTRWSGEPIQEFSPALDYADDGWRTDSVTGFAGGSRPPEPPEQPEQPEQPERPRGGAHRATGGTGPEIVPSSLPAAPTASAAETADTAPQTFITASRRAAGARRRAPIERTSRRPGTRPRRDNGDDEERHRRLQGDYAPQYRERDSSQMPRCISNVSIHRPCL